MNVSNVNPGCPGDLGLGDKCLLLIILVVYINLHVLSGRVEAYHRMEADFISLVPKKTSMDAEKTGAGADSGQAQPKRQRIMGLRAIGSKKRGDHCTESIIREVEGRFYKLERFESH